MITNEYTGWLIHKRRVAENATLLSVLTQAMGIVRVRLSGQRKQAIAQPFTPLWCAVDERPYGLYIREIECLAASPALSGQYLFAGLYLNELINYTLSVNQAEPAVFSAYEDTLRGLAQQPNAPALEALLRRFEWQLLVAAGVSISLTHTADDDTTPIQADNYYRLIPGAGFQSAVQGFSGAHILALARDELSNLEVLRTAKRIMRLAIDHLLNGQPLQSRRLYPRG
jgi:DNA repair protein RecO (recombination protein O)